MKFSELIKELRKRKKIGIKKLGVDLGLNYTYLSKMENEKATPSAEVIERIAKYFDYDKDELMLAANRIPPDVLEILRKHPKEATDYLRSQFGGTSNQSSRRTD